MKPNVKLVTQDGQELTKEEVTWKDKVTLSAMAMAQSMESSFIRELNTARGFLPDTKILGPGHQKVDYQNMSELMDIFLDYLTGTTVAIATTYVNSEKEFEKHYMMIIRDKFERMREIHEERKKNEPTQ